MGLRSIISHRRWEMDGFLKHKPMQRVGIGHLKPSCWREVDASPILDPATGGVEWMGEKGRSHAAPYCWITGDGKAVGFGCRLITCLCSSWFTQASVLNSKQRGTCPAVEGMSLLPLHAHAHVPTHSAQRAFGKHSLAPSWFLCTVTRNTAPSPILLPLLPLKLLQHVALLLYAAAFLRALQIVED